MTRALPLFSPRGESERQDGCASPRFSVSRRAAPHPARRPLARLKDWRARQDLVSPHRHPAIPSDARLAKTLHLFFFQIDIFSGNVAERASYTFRAGAAPVSSFALCAPASLVAKQAYLEVSGEVDASAEREGGDSRRSPPCAPSI